MGALSYSDEIFFIEIVRGNICNADFKFRARSPLLEPKLRYTEAMPTWYQKKNDPVRVVFLNRAHYLKTLLLKS